MPIISRWIHFLKYMYCSLCIIYTLKYILLHSNYSGHRNLIRLFTQVCLLKFVYSSLFTQVCLLKFVYSSLFTQVCLLKPVEWCPVYLLKGLLQNGVSFRYLPFWSTPYANEVNGTGKCSTGQLMVIVSCVSSVFQVKHFC